MQATIPMEAFLPSFDAGTSILAGVTRDCHPSGRDRRRRQGQDIEVLRSIPLLDGAAVSAALQWEDTPSLLDGVPVPVIMTVTINFKLN